MNMIDAVKVCLTKYIDFTGRARKAEFWWWVLAVFLLQLILSALADGSTLENLVGLLLVLPGLAVGARRLHDTGKSGWWQLLWLIPIAGWIVLIIFWIGLGDRGPNQYGPDPLEDEQMIYEGEINPNE